MHTGIDQVVVSLINLGQTAVEIVAQQLRHPRGQTVVFAVAHRPAVGIAQPGQQIDLIEGLQRQRRHYQRPSQAAKFSSSCKPWVWLFSGWNCTAKWRKWRVWTGRSTANCMTWKISPDQLATGNWQLWERACSRCKRSGLSGKPAPDNALPRPDLSSVQHGAVELQRWSSGQAVEGLGRGPTLVDSGIGMRDALPVYQVNVRRFYDLS